MEDHLTVKEIASDIQDIGAGMIFLGGAILFSQYTDTLGIVAQSFYFSGFFYTCYWTFIGKYHKGKNL